MDYKEAILHRTSRRSYTGEPMDAKTIKALQTNIDEYNTHSGLRIRLITDGADAFNGLRKSYGMFSRVTAFIAMIALADDAATAQRIGYYGEKLVLDATRMGLGTCWVGGTFDRKSLTRQLAPEEKLYAVITVGKIAEQHTLKERMLTAAIHRKQRPPEHFYDTSHIHPQWFLDGIAMVIKAPSAVNRQPVYFELKDGIVTGKATTQTGSELVDLGIAKLHFEIGADYIFYDLL